MKISHQRRQGGTQQTSDGQGTRMSKFYFIPLKSLLPAAHRIQSPLGTVHLNGVYQTDRLNFLLRKESLTAPLSPLIIQNIREAGSAIKSIQSDIAEIVVIHHLAAVAPDRAPPFSFRMRGT